MTILDWLVLGAFFLLLFLVIWWVIRHEEETTADFFLGGRHAGWVVIGVSIFASNIGSEHLVCLAGAGAETGMAMAHWEMHGWLILVPGWVFVPFYSRSKVFTMPEFLERRYNSASRNCLSIISLVNYVLTKVRTKVRTKVLMMQPTEYWKILPVYSRCSWSSSIHTVKQTGIRKHGAGAYYGQKKS